MSTSSKVLPFVAALAILAATGCAIRYPAVAPVREKQFRTEPIRLPLDARDRSALEEFLSKGGNRLARNPTPDRLAEAHKKILDALENQSHLKVRTDLATSNFCAIAAALCQAAPVFRKWKVATEVVDARADAPPVPSPYAVSDGEYWWVFRFNDQRQLDQVLVMRTVARGKP
jgi:hypothetical protein